MRKSPIKVSGNNPSEESFDIAFPEGYTEIEFIPEEFTLRNPMDKNEVWLEQIVKTNIVNNILHVNIIRKTHQKRAASFDPDFAPYFREWNRKASSPAAKTITIRKRVKK
jgi:hypothetical protein